MSSIPQGAVAITFAPDRTAVDSFLAELRKGVTVPFNVAPGPGGASGFMPGVSRAPAWAAASGAAPSLGGGSGPGGGAVSDAAARRVDMAWDRAALAQQKAAEAAERRARAQEDRERRMEARERERMALAETRSLVVPKERATKLTDADVVDDGWGIKPGRLAQYATAGFLLNEAGRLGAAWMTRRNEMALAQTGMDRARAEMGFANAVTNVPFVGPIAGAVADLLPMNFIRSIVGNHAASPFEAQKAMLGAEAGERAVAARLAAFSLQEEASTLVSTTPGIDRQIQQLRDEVVVAKQRAAEESHPEVKAGLTTQASALRLKNEAEIADLNRQRRLAMDREQRSAAGLSAAAEGRFGLAADRLFNAELEQSFEDAAPLGLSAMAQVFRNNLMRRAARDAEIRVGIEDRDSEVRALGFEMRHDPLGAMRERLAGQLKHDLHYAKDADDERSVRELYGTREKFETQKRAEDIDIERRGIRAQIESLGFIVNGAGSPAERYRAAEANSILRRTQLDEVQAFRANKGELAPDIARLGALQIGQMKEEFFNSLKAVEVDPSRVALSGPATESAKDVVDKLDKVIDELKKIPDSFERAIENYNARAGD